jgi:hypothetical protein
MNTLTELITKKLSEIACSRGHASEHIRELAELITHAMLLHSTEPLQAAMDGVNRLQVIYAGDQRFVEDADKDPEIALIVVLYRMTYYALNNLDRLSSAGSKASPATSSRKAVGAAS